MSNPVNLNFPIEKWVFQDVPYTDLLTWCKICTIYMYTNGFSREQKSTKKVSFSWKPNKILIISLKNSERNIENTLIMRFRSSVGEYIGWERIVCILDCWRVSGNVFGTYMYLKRTISWQNIQYHLFSYHTFLFQTVNHLRGMSIFSKFLAIFQREPGFVTYCWLYEQSNLFHKCNYSKRKRFATHEQVLFDSFRQSFFTCNLDYWEIKNLEKG